MSNFGSFSYFQTFLSLGVEQGLQKLPKFDINDLILLFHCNILIHRKCPRKTLFKAQCWGPSKIAFTGQKLLMPRWNKGGTYKQVKITNTTLQYFRDLKSYIIRKNWWDHIWMAPFISKSMAVGGKTRDFCSSRTIVSCHLGRRSFDKLFLSLCKKVLPTEREQPNQSRCVLD